MNALTNWAPDLHSIVIHFPIALLATAVLSHFLSLFLTSRTWVRRMTVVLYLLGEALAVAAYFTGLEAVEAGLIPASAVGVLHDHADSAFVAVWLFGLLAPACLVSIWVPTLRRLRSGVILFLLALIGSLFLLETTEQGAELVYRFGVGTAPAQKVEQLRINLAQDRPGVD